MTMEQLSGCELVADHTHLSTSLTLMGGTGVAYGVTYDVRVSPVQGCERYSWAVLASDGDVVAYGVESTFKQAFDCAMMCFTM